MTVIAPAHAPIAARAPAQTPEHSGVSVEIVSGADFARIPRAQWRALMDNALEDNPFLAQQMAQASVVAFDQAHTIRALVLRLKSNGKLVGLVPYRTISPLGVIGIGSASTQLNLYQVNGAPLIDSAHAKEAVDALILAMRTMAGAPRYCAFPHIHADGALARLIGDRVKHQGGAAQLARPYERPRLVPHEGGFDAHVEQIVGKKRAKDIKRNLRRLGELGTVTFERSADCATVAKRVEDFLRIEQAGWKGARGTAFLSKEHHARFAREGFRNLGDGHVTADSLLLDGVPIAISLNIGSGKTLFTPKCAFNETYRKYGPGLVLEYLVIEAFYEQTAHTEMDAATTIDGHLIAGLWNGTKTMGTLVLGRFAIVTHAIAGALDLERTLRQTAKRLLGRR